MICFTMEYYSVKMNELELIRFTGINFKEIMKNETLQNTYNNGTIYIRLEIMQVIPYGYIHLY